MINSLLLTATSFFILGIHANHELVEKDPIGDYDVCRLEEPKFSPVAICIIEDLTLSFEEKVVYCTNKLRPLRKQPYIR
jgi:hypothetical protein